MTNIETIINNIKSGASIIEIEAVNLAASLSPWLAPIIPAYMATDNMTKVLLFPSAVGTIGGIVIELIGISTITTSMQLWDYNQSKRKSDPEAPFVPSLVAVAFYIVVLLTIILVLGGDEVAQWQKVLAKVLLSTLSLVAFIVLAIRSQHARRLQSIADEKQERKDARESKKVQKVPQNVPEQHDNIENVPRKMSERSDWRNLSEEQRDSLIGRSKQEIAQEYNITEKAASNWLKRLEPEQPQNDLDEW